MDDFWFNFGRLSKWSFEFLWVEGFIYVTILLLINILLAVVIKKPFESGKWRTLYWGILLQFLFYPAIVIVGVLGWVEGRALEINPVSEYSQVLFNLFSLGTGIFYVVKMKGLRWFALSVFLFCQWMLLGCNWVTSMAITGVWM
jgi:hypothetical protein